MESLSQSTFMKLFKYILIGLLTANLYAQKLHTYVNPIIGTDGTGHTFPGATLPFGMVQLSPDTRIDGSWEGCSGYHYSDSKIYGFSHTHLSGTGVSDYGDILLMPTFGDASINPEDYISTFSHQKEIAKAGYYEVFLDKPQVKVQLTTSARVGFHQYTFQKAGQANIVLDLNHRDELVDGEIKIIDSKTILVMRRSKAWATNQWVFAYIQFNQPMELSKVKFDQLVQKGHYTGKNLGIAVSKKVKSGEVLQCKVALSFTGTEGAQLNSKEITHWDFNKVRTNAEIAWESELSKIEIKTTNPNHLSVFYTALYHTMMHPNIAQDIDGTYRGMDQRLHKAEGFDYYTVFSLWDTFRGAHPLYTLIQKKRTVDFIQTFIKMYQQGGKIPVWELAANETNCMIGYHSVSVIADAMAKGFTGFDFELAFEASKHSAMQNDLGLKAFRHKGYIGVEDDHESVSKTLEYAYDDWCIAQMAKILGKTEDEKYFLDRSQHWKNLWNKQNKMIQPKKNGRWVEPFDPKEVSNHYTEANGWQYNFFVPHDIDGYIQKVGGAEVMEQKLDEMFQTENTSGRHQVDITGLIGQYAHGNEPSHHFAYLYHFAGKPEKTKEKVHWILENFYTNQPDGLIGNEDCGQMSAWYVLSSMGIYNVCPGQPHWTPTEPFFEEIKVNFEDGTQKIIRKNTPSEELQKFGWEHINVSKNSNLSPFITVPVIEAPLISFEKSVVVPIILENQNHQVYYALQPLNEFNFKPKFQLYTEPIICEESMQILAYSTNGARRSKTVEAIVTKKPNNYEVKLTYAYNPQYHANGANGLVDGVFGNENWRKGDWQGFQNSDFEAIIDLKTEKNIQSIGANFLQDTRSWILMPTEVSFYVSNNGVDFTLVETIKHTIAPDNYESIIQTIQTEQVSGSWKFVKVTAKNFGKLPEWHQGYPFNGDAFIFIDEVIIK